MKSGWKKRKRAEPERNSKGPQQQNAQQGQQAPHTAPKRRDCALPLQFIPPAQALRQAKNAKKGGVADNQRFWTPVDPDFDHLLSSSYRGFVVDPPSSALSKEGEHDQMRAAFERMSDLGIFQTDVTQPGGLGTKCALTMVSRTLLGEAGTTYKYLGLRMFAHPWTAQDAPKGAAHEAIRSVHLLNQRLVQRSSQHLEALKEARARDPRGDVDGRRHSDGVVGSCRFSLSLVNCMLPKELKADLKREPLFNRDKASVSWHADSCLDHFSTIAVYHVTTPPRPADSQGGPKPKPMSVKGKGGHKKAKTTAESSTQGGDGQQVHAARVGAAPHVDDWRIALRVSPHAEGPSAGKMNSSGGSGPETPSIALTLPSRSAYYLLDDFNHHHQHTVLSGSSHRYSSTHRVAKTEGHTYGYIAARCEAVLKSPPKRSFKQWKAEQLLLSELEMEWVRQFYVQGRRHEELHEWWAGPMKALLTYWSRLEERTLLALACLSGAAEHAQDKAQPSPLPCGSKEGGKARRKRQKHFEALKAFELRGGASPREAYTALAEALEEREAMRDGWAQREADPAFRRLPVDCHPLPVPLLFSHVPPGGGPGPGKGRTHGVSALPAKVGALAAAVRHWGDAFARAEDMAGGRAGGGSGVMEAYGEGQQGGLAAAAFVPLGHFLRQGGEQGGGGDATGGVGEAEGHCGSASGSAVDDVAVGGTAAAAAEEGEVEDEDEAAHGVRWADMPGVALEVQQPWASKLLTGDKTIETRRYALPAALLGRRLRLLESRPGVAGRSTVTDAVPEGAEGLREAGSIVFERSFLYGSERQWREDERKHLVRPDSAYGWGTTANGSGSGLPLYGWVVKPKSAMMHETEAQQRVPALQRRMRSLFEVVGGEGKGEGEGEGEGTARRENGKTKRRSKRKREDERGGEQGSSSNAGNKSTKGEKASKTAGEKGDVGSSGGGESCVDAAPSPICNTEEEREARRRRDKEEKKKRKKEKKKKRRRERASELP